MPTYVNNEYSLHYEVYGAGRPVLFLHDLAVNFAGTFVACGWVDQFLAKGYQVIGLDFCGHGWSEKPHSPLARADYPTDLPPQISAYWTFATTMCGDRKPSWAAASADYPAISPEEVTRIGVPVLVISGQTDTVLGRGSALARTLPNGRYLEIARAGHFALAAHAQTQEETIEFLADSPDHNVALSKTAP